MNRKQYPFTLALMVLCTSSGAWADDAIPTISSVTVDALHNLITVNGQRLLGPKNGGVQSATLGGKAVIIQPNAIATQVW